MKVSYNWLQDHIDGKLPDPESLGETLTMGAYELEGIEKVGDDFILDFDVQPNRAADSFGHYGIAKEIGVLTGLPVKEYKVDGSKEDFKSNLEVKVDVNECYRYVGREIKNIQIKESPDLIKKRLEALGQRSINNIVDFTNYIMLDTGRPMHAFDKDKISGDIIYVRMAEKGEKLVTLDGKEVTFDGDEMLVADGKEALVIAGIKGGSKAEVDKNTTNIIIEAANWDSAKIRFIRRKIGIETDSSKRFERGISPNWAEDAIKKMTDLVLEYASTDKTEVGNIVDYYPRPAGVFKTGISLEEINKRLGTSFSNKEVEDIIDRLKFEYKKVNAKENFVELAKSVEGKPYVFGASVLYDAPNGFDCSSYISYCAKESGQSIPRMVIDQYVWATEISKEDLEIGDLVFSNKHSVSQSNQEKFKDRPEIQSKVCSEHDVSKEFMPGTKIDNAVDHVGIYLGENRIIHCTGETGVTLEDLDNSDGFKDIISYRRILEKDEERYVVTIPRERIDIRKKEDITEEIARVYGINNIPPQEIKRESERVLDPIYFYQTKISKFLIDNGFSEIMTYTLQNKGSVEISNPMATDKNFMRDTLITGLRESLVLNMHNAYLLGLDAIKVFEFGKVFYDENEKWMLSIGLEIKDAKKNKSKLALEEVINSLGEHLGIKLDAKIVDDTMLEIDLEKLVSTLPAPKSEDYYELDLENKDIAYKPFSVYPFILRDIAVWVPSGVSEDEVLDLIKKESGDLLVTSRLFDKYEKEEEKKVSYAFRLVFQSYEKTLTDDEINPIMNKVTELLGGKGFEVR